MEKVKSYAKINLLLKVIDKKENGYHNLQMVNKRINLYDEITIEYFDKDLVEFSINIDPSFIYKVLKRIKDIYNIKKYFHIFIKKNIPVGAGLGGASVNAATIIDTILKMECISDTTENKIKSFKDLGADIPYGFFEKDAIVEGIGDEIYTLEEQINKNLVLVNPGVFVSTKNVFLENEHYSDKLSHKYIQENVNNDDLYQNDLEAATFKIYPDLANIKYRLGKYGKVVMSGTGSSFIVHTENDIKIKEENPNYLVVKIN